MTEPVAAPTRSDWMVSAPFLAVAVVCSLFAFVGLDASSYWIDELFSLYVVDHDGGLGEVLRRALTDTHPPAYYFIAYEWIQLFGSSETATRSLSAIFGVAALPVLFFGLRRTFSLPARSFAIAMAAGSKLFFQQTQDVRSYSLCVLISSVLLVLALAIHRRQVSDQPVSAGLLAALWGVGLLGGFTHFYLFLVVGCVHLFLLLTARTSRDRMAIVVSGLIILGLVSVYVVRLLHSSQQDMHNMWFSNKPKLLIKEALGGLTQAWSWLSIAGVALLALAPWVDRARLATGRTAPPPPPAPLAPLGLCALVIGGTLVAGLAVSFTLAPSFGTRNLIVLGPFLWAITAWLYDAIGPDPRRGPSLALIVLLIALTGSNALAVATRLHPQAEGWRSSAAYVDRVEGCAGAPIPVILPFVFGPSTPFFRDLAETYFFGRYETHPERLAAYTPTEFSPPTANAELRTLLRDRAASSGCRVLAWGVHDLDEPTVEDLKRDIAATAGLPESRVLVRTFSVYKVGLLGKSKPQPRAFVFERLD